MSRNVKTSRNVTADYQRGIAAILVVTEHLIARDIAFFGDDNLFFYMMLYALMQVYFFYAGAFAISGLKKKAGVFFSQKALRLMVPYFMWSSVAVAAKALISILNGSFDLMQTVTLELQTLLYAKSMWFLLSLFLMQALFWVLYRLYQKSPAAAGIVAVVVMLLPLPDMLTFLKTQEMMPAFAIGIFYAQHKQTIHDLMGKYRKVLWIPCAAFLACAPVYAKYAANNRMSSGLHFLLANLIALLTAFAFWYLLELLLHRAETFKNIMSTWGGAVFLADILHPHGICRLSAAPLPGLRCGVRRCGLEHSVYPPGYGGQCPVCRGVLLCFGSGPNLSLADAGGLVKEMRNHSRRSNMPK